MQEVKTGKGVRKHQGIQLREHLVWESSLLPEDRRVAEPLPSFGDSTANHVSLSAGCLPRFLS